MSVTRAAEIVELTREMESAIYHMHSWLAPGGSCCGAPREHGYCTSPPCISRRERYAAEWAIDAAHAINQLEAIFAERERRTA